MTTVEIIVSSDQHHLSTHAFKTVRVSVHSTTPWHDDDFQAIVRRVDFDKVPAMLDRLEAKYNVRSTSHHREQYALLAEKRAGARS